MENFEKIYYDGNCLLHFYTGNIQNSSLSLPLYLDLTKILTERNVFFYFRYLETNKILRFKRLVYTIYKLYVKLKYMYAR